jgi:hypothetical protein
MLREIEKATRKTLNDLHAAASGIVKVSDLGKTARVSFSRQDPLSDPDSAGAHAADRGPQPPVSYISNLSLNLAVLLC